MKNLQNSIAVAKQAANHASESIGMFRQLNGITSDLSLVKTKLVDDKPVDSDAIQLATLRADRFGTLTLIGGNIAALEVQKELLPRAFRDEEANFKGDYQKLMFASGTAADLASEPSESRRRAKSLPMPEDAPVTSATGLVSMVILFTPGPVLFRP